MNTTKCSKFSKLIAALLVLTFVVGMIPMNVFATETAQIIVDQTYAMVGSTVSVDVDIKNNTGISNALMTLTYHADLELTAVTRGNALDSLYFTKPNKLVSPCNFLWDSLDTEDSDDGTLVTLTFKVKETATPGTFCNIEMSFLDGDITDGNDQAVAVETVAGYIEVLDYEPGDVNNDGSINGTDVSLIRRYIVGDSVNVNTYACDVNADGRVNGTDVVMLRRFITGGYGVEFKPGKDVCNHVNIMGAAANEPTCTEDGNTAYWYCADCGLYFADELGTTSISEAAARIPATGHTEVLDKAVAPTYNTTGLTEGVHCSTCNAVIKAQETVAKLQPTAHAIMYQNLYGAETPEPNFYYEHEGLLELPEPERNGYAFVGWFTASEGGEVVDYILPGSTQDYILFAVWEKETYEILYFNVPLTEGSDELNPDSYTVDSTFMLKDPKWSGLKFTGWTDQYGNLLTKIEKGSSGDLELTANWKRQRNIANPGNTKGLLTTYNAEDGVYHFIYEIGTIEHVVLEDVSIGSSNLKYNSGATDLVFSLEETVTVSDFEAKAIATTVSEAVSQSHEWERAKEWGEETSNSHEVSVSASAEFGIGPVTTTIETEYGYTNTSSESWGKSEAESGSVEIGGETVETSSATVSYMKTISNTVEREITISKDSPVGYYSYVHAGNVKVFGIVTYNPADNTFYLDTYSILNNMHEMMLYYRDVNELNDQSSEPLSYDIPRDRILEIVDNAYFVKYEPNTAESGEMEMSVHAVGEKITLSDNAYVKPGYTFRNWLASDGLTYYADGASDLDALGSMGQLITLTAQWSKNDYTIVYNANVPAHASTTVSNVPANQLCYYDEDVTLATRPDLKGWNFGGWFSDPECTDFVGYDLVTLTLANLTTEPHGTVNLYAKWYSFPVSVKLDVNGGNDLGYEYVDLFFNDNYGELPIPVRSGYLFMGWYLGDQKITADTQIVNDRNHTLTASWLLYSQTTHKKFSVPWYDPDEGYPDERKRVTDSDGVYDSAFCDIDVEALKALGYTRFKVTVEFQACEVNDGYIEVWVCNGNKTRLANYKGDPVSNTHKYKWVTTSFTVDIDAIAPVDGYFYIEYGASGDWGDDWQLGGSYITIEAIH